ncbi:hypothetical protein NUSPORA_02605 [Nucleospora cyclopteri]
MIAGEANRSDSLKDGNPSDQTDVHENVYRKWKDKKGFLDLHKVIGEQSSNVDLALFEYLRQSPKESKGGERFRRAFWPFSKEFHNIVESIRYARLNKMRYRLNDLLHFKIDSSRLNAIEDFVTTIERYKC